MRNVYIQADAKGSPINVNLYAAYDGFDRKAYDVALFRNLPPVTSTDDIVCGTVATVRAAWRELGITPPDLIDYPESLDGWLGRTMQETTLGEIRKNVFSGTYTPQFIKPSKVHKLFPGHVIHSPASLIATAMLDDDTAVWESDTVKFESEWRVFVLRGKILGIKNYHGDPFLVPTLHAVEHMIADYADAPVAYSLDIGLTDWRKPLLVEVNDSYALGNYGLDSFDYANMIEARWDEVCKLSD